MEASRNTAAEVMAWDQALAALALRNGAVQLTTFARADTGDPAPIFRARLLALEATKFLVERPQRAEAGHYLVRDNPVMVLLIEQKQRWEFVTRVLDMTRFRLNQGLWVPAVVLAMPQPQSVRSAQRRNFYRVAIAGIRVPTVQMTPLPDDPAVGSGQAAAILPQAVDTVDASGQTMEMRQPHETPLQPSFAATLVNIGGGGIGVETPQRVTAEVAGIVRYRCVLTLPMLESPIEVAARVVHQQPHKDGTCYLGLCFEFEDSGARRRVADQICRFTTWCQRQQLQHQSEKR